jgi:chitinase
MTKLKLYFTSILIISAVIISSTLFTKDIPTAQAATVQISDKSLTLELGHYKTLRISGTTKKASWHSSNTWVATVTSGGKVTAKATGTATITASVNGKKLTCKLTVIRLKDKTVTLVSGYTQTLKVTGTAGKVTWSSSDSDVASVSSNGTVTAKASGTATITASVDGKKLTSSVTVVGINYDDILLEEGGITGNYRILSILNTKSKVAWSSTDNSVVTVSSSGKVLAKGPGTATVKASVNGLIVTCKVRVISENIRNFTLKMGETEKLEIYGNIGEVIWHSNKKSVANVSSDGVVSTVAPGSAIIMAYVDDMNVMARVTVVE